MLMTAVNPAFWLAHNEKEYNPSAACTVGIDRVNVSAYTMRKTVQLGIPGFPRAVFYNGSVFVPEDQPFVQTEGPTAYMPGWFNSFYTFNFSTGATTLIPHPSGGSSGSTNDALIFATSDGSAAMGVFTTNNVQYYGWFDFSYIQPGSDSTTKWTLVNWNDNVAQGTTLQFPAYIVVGSLAQVSQDMGALHALVSRQ
eukprot:m.474776 g.474776  ORF g.474776 m.474776 type:complete len:197 (-) comp57137_c0_seq3:65-655(-)